MSRTYYFGKQRIEFERWCKVIKRCRYYIKTFYYSSLEVRDYKEFEESKLVINQYKVLHASLNVNERQVLHELINNKYERDNDWLYETTYLKWKEVLFGSGKTRIKIFTAKELGQILFEARESAGYSIEEVSRILEIPSRTIQRWEKGINFPSVVWLYNLSLIYDKTFFELLKYD